ncbi:hypothetical protein [Spiroplasma endosymbiont of Nebria brevicollis]|uniref:hypothetical protein n=1 Tax=Spiroplasma endosymbiont of Nebria brevicollis TaxID=3066284 RepID=UPI00313CDCE9
MRKNNKITNTTSKVFEQSKFTIPIHWFNDTSILNKYITKESYLRNGNISKINNHFKNKDSKSLIFLSIFLLIPAVTIVFTVLTKSTTNDSNFWFSFALFTGLNTILTMILSNTLGRVLPKFKWERNTKEKEEYTFLFTNLLKFKVFLNTIKLNKIKISQLIKYDFIPPYFYLIKEEEIMQNELILWKTYLDTVLRENKLVGIKY